MKYDLSKSLEVLERTPAVLETMLSGLSDDWTNQNEGGDSWSAFDVVGHLIHGEITDWMARMDIILEASTAKTFTPFDRFAQFNESKGKSLKELLNEFKELRRKNVEKLRAVPLTDAILDKKGVHPYFGEVTLRQLLATWTVHDLSHIAQIARVMATQYKEEIGPWVEYIPLLQRQNTPAKPIEVKE